MHRFALIIFFVFTLTSLSSTHSFGGSKKEEYELQEKCGKATSEAFSKKYGNGRWKDRDGAPCFSNYSNHYNSKLNRCFFILETVCYGQAASEEKILWDFNENKEFGSFFLFKKDNEVMKCDVNYTPCSSLSEWYLLTQPFMTE